MDLMNSPMFVIFDTDAYYNSQYGGTDENGNPIPAPKKYTATKRDTAPIPPKAI